MRREAGPLLKIVKKIPSVSVLPLSHLPQDSGTDSKHSSHHPRGSELVNHREVPSALWTVTAKIIIINKKAKTTEPHATDSPFAIQCCVKSLQSCLTLCDPMDCSPPGSSVCGILQARILEQIAISFSRGLSQPRDQYLSLFLHWQVDSLPLTVPGKPAI